MENTASKLLCKEKEESLARYYKEGHFNSPQRVGYVMKMIRTRNPLTEEEWRSWYTEKIHDEAYIEKLTGEMFRLIPPSEGVSYRECSWYIHDVMFRRTFLSYNKAKRGLMVLRELLSPSFEEPSAEWGKTYALHACTKNPAGKDIGIHFSYLPACETGIEQRENVEKKLELFRSSEDALAFTLLYTADNTGNIDFLEPDILEEIREAMKEKEVPLPDKLEVDFKRLGEYTARSVTSDSLVSFPFIVQRRTGQKDLVWFLYTIIGVDEYNLYACVSDVFILAPDRRLTKRRLPLEVSYRREAQPRLDQQKYLKDLERLYRSFSVNKMNSLLWEKGQKALYSSYQAVKAELQKEQGR